MSLNLQDIGAVLHVPAFMCVPTLLVVLSAGENQLLLPFAATGAISATLGQVLYRTGSKGAKPLPGMTSASMALAWLIVPLVGAVPFLTFPLFAEGTAAAVFEDPSNAIFESFSGFTSTGLSVVAHPSELPMSLQWWRSLAEWVGGIGFALLMLIAMNPEGDADALYRSELGKTFTDSIRQTVCWIWWTYGGLTLAGIAAFWAFGMPAWEAVNHGMTTVATGGFTITDDSFRSYSPLLQGTAIVFMLLGAISFAAYHECLRQRSLLSLIKRPPVVALLVASAFATLVLWASRSHFEDTVSLMDAAFHVVSSLATAGFNSVDLGDWHSASLAVLVACMVVGGASGATTGGLKLDRVIIILRGTWWRLRRPFKAYDRTQSYRIAGESLTEDQARLRVEAAATLAAVWLVTLLLGSLALAPVVGQAPTFTEIVFEVASALGSVGLSAGIATADLATTGKWTLIVLMWLGRLEIFAALSLFYLLCRPLFRQEK